MRFVAFIFAVGLLVGVYVIVDSVFAVIIGRRIQALREAERGALDCSGPTVAEGSGDDDHRSPPA